MASTSAAMVASERLAPRAASAAIFVPSIAIVPSEASPALAHSANTSMNTARSASSWWERNRAMAMWSGNTSAQIALKARSARQAASMRRDDRRPRQ